jgi:hypothetical protein
MILKGKGLLEFYQETSKAICYKVLKRKTETRIVKIKIKIHKTDITIYNTFQGNQISTYL